MDDGWTSHPSAPPEERVVARVEQLPNRIALLILVDSRAGTSPILLAASCGIIRAFVTACSHRNLPLDYSGPKPLSCDSAILRCTNHGSRVRVEDGAGVEGLGIGCRLEVIAVVADKDGLIRVRRSGDARKTKRSKT